MIKKKSTKEHPLTAFRKTNEARQTIVKASMKKMQTGGTPYQQYMTIPGAVASDTIPSKKIINSYGTAYSKTSLEKPKAKNPKNTNALINATEKTYGMDVWDRPSQGHTGNKYLTPAQDKELRRMGPMKKGGAIKKSLTKAQTGGTSAPKSNSKMLETINKNPAQYKRDRTPDVKKIYTDRNIPLTGSMSSADSLRMADIETGLWNDTTGRKASSMAVGCKKQKIGGTVKSKKK